MGGLVKVGIRLRKATPRQGFWFDGVWKVGYDFGVVERNHEWSFKVIWETLLYLSLIHI